MEVRASNAVQGDVKRPIATSSLDDALSIRDDGGEVGAVGIDSF